MKQITSKLRYTIFKKLRFDYRDYVFYIQDENFNNNWSGFSIQNKMFRENQESSQLSSISLIEEIGKFYERMIIKLAEEYEVGKWIMTHDYNRYQWVTNHIVDANPILLFFRENGIESNYRGILFDDFDVFRDSLLSFVEYPFMYKKEDINFFNVNENFIIRFTHHLTLDIITSDYNNTHKLSNLLLDELNCDFQKIDYS